MKTRMIAIDKIFSKYPRLIRDLTANAKKEIQLRISGEETELDKSIIEQINDPLVHLLRNSIDHGIEPPDVRESQRKPRRGTIWLSAEQRGDYINITVRDDGKGIDPDLIKKKAVEKGLITEEKSNAMDREEIYNLLFLPGFSTKETTSDVSGRGVGMDVVKTSIERLNGTVEIQSEIGKGTSISLRFPLTLAIIQVQLVRVGADMYAIPNIFVSEIVKIPKKQIIRIVGHNEVLKLRDQVIPLLDLQEIFEVETTSGERDWVYVVVTLMGDRKIGVIVDDVRGQEEIVIKSLGEYLKRYGECFAGATIMGDGKVILIIDLAAVWKLATGQFTITKEV
jgi:two-component system chemotaxis sensor kinase CheA